MAASNNRGNSSQSNNAKVLKLKPVQGGQRRIAQRSGINRPSELGQFANKLYKLGFPDYIILKADRLMQSGEYGRAFFHEWPDDQEECEDVLLAAGYKRGPALLEAAKEVWNGRPSWCK